MFPYFASVFQKFIEIVAFAHKKSDLATLSLYKSTRNICVFRFSFFEKMNIFGAYLPNFS